MTLFLVGGGPSAALNDVHDAYAASVGFRARGHAPRVAYLSVGRREDVGHFASDYTAPLLERLPQCEVVEVYLDAPVAAEQTEAVEQSGPSEQSESSEQAMPDLSEMDGIIIAGGHTPSYVSALAAHRSQLSRLVSGDVPVIGYSAGAMAASRHAFVGGFRHQGRQVGNEEASEGLDEVSIVDGLALVSPTVVCHNDAWGLDGLAITIVEQNWSRTVVALDEDACLIVDPISGRTALYGTGRIRWFTRDAGGISVKTQYPDD